MPGVASCEEAYMASPAGGLMVAQVLDSRIRVRSGPGKMQKVHFPMKNHKSVFIEPFGEGKPAGSEGSTSCYADISLDDQIKPEV